jgi:hypothetical protein
MRAWQSGAGPSPNGKIFSRRPGWLEKPLRVLMIETAAGSGYVVAGAVGWREDGGQDHDPSSLALLPSW